MFFTTLSILIVSEINEICFKYFKSLGFTDFDLVIVLSLVLFIALSILISSVVTFFTDVFLFCYIF